ncbi:MAG: methionyl-tRNA formyltransferase, partial [Anaerolineae bacterium]|nr:methionyl-tRNA formyltransferase [Anaerolineae bacterium]
AVPALDALLRDGYAVVGVLTRQDQPAGRGQQVEVSPVKQAAMARGLPIQQPKTLRSPDALAALAGFAPDLVVVAAYGLILPQTVLDLPRFGCVNVHGSLLPRHRGAAPIAAAILAGDTQAGVSIMLMDAGVDTGPVLGTAALPVASDDTTGSLTAKLAQLGGELLIATLPRYLAGETDPQPQLSEGATYAPRLEKAAGRIDWREPAAIIERKVRAYQPWPSAYTSWNGQRLKILRARVGPGAGVRGQESGGRSQGEVIAGERGAVGVVTGEGVLWLDEVQAAGKRPMLASAFVAGARGFVGSWLEA